MTYWYLALAPSMLPRSSLHTLGAKVSATKCFLFSTCAATRELFRQRYWAHLGTRIQVYMSARDLGGQLCLGLRLVGTTLNQRITRAIEICNRLAHQPWSRESKVKMVFALVLPTAL